MQPDSTQSHKPLITPRRFSRREIAIRLFLTCWIVYVLHYATNIVREIYPALALGDHFSFRVDEYANMHPDIFEKEGYGWHIGNNPGASMVAAIPYFLARPVIDPIVNKVKQIRLASGQTEPPTYDSSWPMARDFYKEAWKRGYDVKFALGSFVMQAFAMAPISALGVVVMFYLLSLLLSSNSSALWLSILYAFGTPVFFRTGYLNQNMMLGHIAFAGFVAMWNPKNFIPWSKKTLFFIGGFAGGTALLFDYSGAIFLMGLFCYGIIKGLRESSKRDTVKLSILYILGTLIPVFLLWFYQWKSFGNPFLPGQNWMPPVQWSNLGYQGYGLPQLDLLGMLAFDYRFGLFISCPLMLLAILAPLIDRTPKSVLPKIELWFMLAVSIALWIFFGGSNYTRLQFNTGIRYLSPVFPFLFVPTAIVLKRLPHYLVASIAILSIALSWSLAMYRDVELGFGILEPVLHVFLGGLQLPVLNTISRFKDLTGGYMPFGPSPIPLLLLAGAIIFMIWFVNPLGGNING